MLSINANYSIWTLAKYMDQVVKVNCRHLYIFALQICNFTNNFNTFSSLKYYREKYKNF